MGASSSLGQVPREKWLGGLRRFSTRLEVGGSVLVLEDPRGPARQPHIGGPQGANKGEGKGEAPRGAARDVRFQNKRAQKHENAQFCSMKTHQPIVT